MHACLNMDEIVRLIACELVVSRAEATTVALACCHKGFEDPVLDALWETQEHLLPLLKSLPEDVWNEGGCTVSAPTLPTLSSLNYLVLKSFKRLPTTQEWTRFREYARRMRKLGGSGALQSAWSPVLSVLQSYAVNESLLPNLKILDLRPDKELVPFIPLFISPRTSIIRVWDFQSNLPKAMVASMIANFPTRCPNLQEITLYFLPSDPMVAAAVSGILLTNNRYALRCFRVDSPLTEEAHQVIWNLPDLRNLSVVIEKDVSLPSVVLPNLTNLEVKYDHDNDLLRVFHGATFGKLAAVTLHSGSKQIGDFLEAFERVALAASVQNTLSNFSLYTQRPWNPNYSSLLPFTQLTMLDVQFPCRDGCSSTVDDDVITNLARAMPRLRILELGDPPCHDISIGVTAKGLMILANHCPNLHTLCVHLQVDSLCVPPAISEVPPGTRFTALRRDCTLSDLVVGEIPLSEESVPTIALTLAHIFPHIESIDYSDENWDKVMDAICNSREIINRSSEEHPHSIPRSNLSDTSPGATLEGVI